MNKEHSRVRIGVIGPSWWVDYWHLPAIVSHPRADLVGIAGAKNRSAEEVRAKYGELAVPYDSWDQMLAEAELDGAIVCTPNCLHHPATMAALRAGVHVACEKPLAMDSTQAREMALAAEAAGLLGMTNFPYRDNPAVQAMRSHLAEGAIGRILTVTARYNGGFGLNGPPGWRGTRSRSGAGILGDLGSHLIDLVWFVTGLEFRSVCSHSLTMLPGAGGPSLIRAEDPRAGDRNDDSCAFLAELEGGVQAILQTSWLAYQGAGTQDQQIEICGTEGSLRFLASHSGTILQIKRKEDVRWQTAPVAGIVLPVSSHEEDEDYFRPGRHGHTNTTYRWIEAIANGAGEISPSLRDGWRAQRVIDAVIDSGSARQWVEVAH